MLKKITDAIQHGSSIIKIKGITGQEFVSLSFSVWQKFQKPILILAEDVKIARFLYKEIREMNSKIVHYLEPKEEIDFEVIAHDKDVTYNRLKTLNQMANNPNQVFVMAERAFAQNVVDKKHFALPMKLSIGQATNLENIIQHLTNLGYINEVAVEGLGQFSVRGGIIDISGVNGDFRIELFGDEIDSIRKFDVNTQRSTQKIDNCAILPSKEFDESAKIADYFVTTDCGVVPPQQRGGGIAEHTSRGGDDGGAFRKSNDVIILAYNACKIQEELTLLGSEDASIEQLAEAIRIQKADKKEKRKPPAPEYSQKISTYYDLQDGDFVVHQIHGIAKFLGIKPIEINDIRGDYLELAFAGTDKIFVPVQQLDMVFKYVGKNEDNIKLSKLGSTDWKNTKARVKKACQDIAEQLIALYAKRQEIAGRAFSEDTEWQIEFEETLEYDETPDQLRAIEEVKTDMEAHKPMDRLLCGDVGYGKTEVAMRAAFKAVIDRTQVAYLCPTTVLASQHFETFTKRMNQFGVKIELLSRFRTAKEQKATLERLASGQTDIVIGTHRLLQKDVKYKNLGLLIIDEEQRFGVTHKERIKEIKTNVDVLTLSATPIPRTLHMSLVGIRDMSTLAKPPRDRYPVATYVLEYDDEVIHKAIFKEIARGGQVYYLHNRVETIQKVASDIAKISPNIEVRIAHGQMKERELEQIMHQMANREIDVLICTTIIETGLDIPNVNTIIIENADRMGLAQLYQLRGRVGRSNRLAHAYLTYRPDKIISEVAEKRLNAIAQFTEFGSGFRIALRDLEIRGAGNLVGAQQSGHMDAIGYDLYCKFLSEAIEDLRNSSPLLKGGADEVGGGLLDDEETLINIPVNAYIPHSYIPGETYRLEMYKRIASLKTADDIADCINELLDRYGKVPPEVQNLIEVAELKSIAESLNLVEIRYIQPEFPGGAPKYLFKMKRGTGDNFTIAGNDPAKIPNLKFLLSYTKTMSEVFNN
ncbi:MAG: transcription-repair coupling factor [Oscillospiraceae bacterium]|nr:transcription-repair coupling factor [Oscillospiraceae bacterium]